MAATEVDAVASVEWSPRDVMLYALGIGAGQDDACTDLEYTTESIAGRGLRVLPTFALTLVQRAGIRPSLRDIDPMHVVHAGQRLLLHRTLPIAGRLVVRSRVAATESKTTGTLIHIDSSLAMPDGGDLVAESRSTLFARNSPDRSVPRRESPSTTVDPTALQLTARTRPDQALLYRLSGDMNPLHSDPAVARAAGFERPILHGLCTLGIAVRRLIAVFGRDPDEIRHIETRFTGPVMPGETLHVEIQRIDDGAAFRVVAGDDRRPALGNGWIGWSAGPHTRRGNEA